MVSILPLAFRWAFQGPWAPRFSRPVALSACIGLSLWQVYGSLRKDV